MSCHRHVRAPRSCLTDCGLRTAPKGPHRHYGIGMHTPSDVHHGHAATVSDTRVAIIATAYDTHTERFVRKPPEPPLLPAAVWINRPRRNYNRLNEPTDNMTRWG